ncbi:hypothetical protein E4U57_006864, partial [Claviceps arundinis]
MFQAPRFSMMIHQHKAEHPKVNLDGSTGQENTVEQRSELWEAWNAQDAHHLMGVGIAKA